MPQTITTTAEQEREAQMLAREYLLCDDNKLTKEAQEYKRKIAKAIVEVDMKETTQATPYRPGMLKAASMLKDSLTPPNAVREFINSVLLETLTDREKRICALRPKEVFGFDVEQLTLRQAGEQEGVSQERMRQIIIKIIRKIRRRIFVINQQIKEPQVIIKYIEKPDTEDVANLPIVYKPVEALGEMTVRTFNVLKNGNIKTVQQLIEKKEHELLRLPNFGRKSLNELKEVLSRQGLKLEEKS